MLKNGLYEQVINNAISDDLQPIADDRKTVAAVDEAEGTQVLSQYLLSVIQRGLADMEDYDNSLSAQVALANKIVTLVQSETNDSDINNMSVVEPAQQLLQIVPPEHSSVVLGKKNAVNERPATSIAHSTLLTASANEPQLYSELNAELKSANRVDMLVSFIKWSGLRLIQNELKTFTNRGGKLRVISTCYMGATDLKVFEELSTLENTERKHGN